MGDDVRWLRHDSPERGKPLVADPVLAVLILAIATGVLSMPQGLASTIIQLIAPNRMRV